MVEAVDETREREREKEEEEARAREKMQRKGATRGERSSEMGREGRAVCVFNFPRPFCMQISSVIYPGRPAEAGEGSWVEAETGGCTCGE